MYKKRIIYCFMMFFAVFGIGVFCTDNAHAESQASIVFINDEIRAGDVMGVTLYLGGSNIKGFTAELVYNDNILTPVNISSLMNSNWSFAISEKKFIAYSEDGSPLTDKAVLALNFKISDNVQDGERVSIGVKNIVVSDGTSDTKYSSVSYGKYIMPKKRSDADMLSFSLINGKLEEEFSPDRMEYNAIVDYNQTRLNFNMTRSAGSRCEFEGNNNFIVGKNRVLIRIIAEDGTKKEYIINVVREQDPLYKKSSNAFLEKIEASVGEVSPVFTALNTNYILFVTYETTNISIKGIPQDKMAICEEKTFVLDYGNNVCRLICTAEDEVTTEEYIVNVYRMPLYMGRLPVINPTNVPTEKPTEVVNEPYVVNVNILWLLIPFGMLIILCIGIWVYTNGFGSRENNNMNNPKKYKDNK